MKFVVLVNGSCSHYSTAERDTHSNDKRSPWPRHPRPLGGFNLGRCSDVLCGYVWEESQPTRWC